MARHYTVQKEDGSGRGCLWVRYVSAKALARLGIDPPVPPMRPMR